MRYLAVGIIVLERRNIAIFDSLSHFVTKIPGYFILLAHYVLYLKEEFLVKMRSSSIFLRFIYFNDLSLATFRHLLCKLSC